MPKDGEMFMAQQGYQHQRVLPDLLTKIRDRHPEWRVGAAVPLPRCVPETHRDLVATLTSIADSFLADPETHRLELPYDERGGKRGAVVRPHYDVVAAHRCSAVDAHGDGLSIDVGAVDADHNVAFSALSRVE